MKTCPKCGESFFTLVGDTHDLQTYLISIEDDGDIITEELADEEVVDTAWHGTVQCPQCSTCLDRETWQELEPGRELFPYTVLLLYPDYIADEFGKETYLAHVMAQGAREAITQAQENALVDNDGTEDFYPLFFYPLLTVRGHLNDLTPDRR